jgi:hypothetical protein
MVQEKIKQLIKTIIYQYDDVFIKRKELILDKEYFISLPQEKQERMVRTSLIGDVSTLLGLLKDLYDLDTTTNKSKFYKFVHINRCDIGEFILEYGESNYIKELYEKLISRKHRNIMRNQAINKSKCFYKLRKMRAKIDYERGIKEVTAEYERRIKLIEYEGRKEIINLYHNPEDVHKITEEEYTSNEIDIITAQIARLNLNHPIQEEESNSEKEIDSWEEILKDEIYI